jgi:tripartite-type tricarboxylate transporter receptor subunit TctC
MGIFVACGESFGASIVNEWKWERKIDIIVGWGAGGGQDSTIRPLAALLEPVLGVPIVITNIEGANGWNSFDYVNRQPADGYTFCMNTPSMIIADLMGQTPANLDYRNGFVPVCKLVHDINIICTSKKSSQGKYSNFPEMLKYAKAHQGEVSIAMLSSTGMDAIGFKIAIGDTPINNVQFNGGAEINSALIGGHVDLGMMGISEIAGLMEAGDIIPLLALTEKKLEMYPNIPVASDYSIKSYLGPYRFITAKAGTPQPAIDSLITAIEQVWDAPSWQEFLKRNSYTEREAWANQKDLIKIFNSDYEVFREYLAGEGLLAK